MPTIDLDLLAKKKADFDKAKHAKTTKEMESMMNNAQIQAYKKVEYLLNNSNNYDNKCFFIYGPGGTGKTFIYKAIYHLALSLDKKIENTAFSGIAATLLPKGKTNHNLFKLPVPITADSTSRIELNSKEGNNLRGVDIIVWDEAPMSPKYALEIANSKLKELTNNNLPFGGKIMLLGGDFRQVLPVKERATHANEIIALSIKSSLLWKEFEIIELTENKRADPNAKQFAQDILEIGNGTRNDKDNMVEIPQKCIIKGFLHEEIFSECIRKRNWKDMSERAILAARNTDVDTHNTAVLSMLPGDERIYTSVDNADNWKGPPLADEVLKRFLDPGFSVSQLKLKLNAIVMLLRNLNIDKGLCNGTRMRVLRMGERLLTCEIITGDKKEKVVLIPKITLKITLIHIFHANYTDINFL